jgi:hypothetical protein
MRRSAVAAIVALLLSAPVLAEEQAEDVAGGEAATKILVLPLGATRAVGGDATRLFDARLLVALDETGRVDAITAPSEPECATADCLAALGSAAGASHVLSTTVLSEEGRLTLFATLIDSSSGVTVKRTELSGLDSTELSKGAAAEVARWVAGASSKLLLGVDVPKGAAGGLAATAMVDRISGLNTIPVIKLDDQVDRSGLSHRMDIKVTNLTIVKQIHHVHHYFDGVFVATLSVTDLSDRKVIFSRTVKTTASKRSRFSSKAEITALLIGGAIDEWMAAFRAEKVETQLLGSQPASPGRKNP